MADEEVDFDEAVDLEDAAMETSVPAKGGVARDKAGRKMKGRGQAGTKGELESGNFDTITSKGGGRGPVQSVEGWIIFISGLHEETQEDDIHDKFCDFGEIKNLHLNLDRRTGFVKGYALVEYHTQKEAQGAIDEMTGESLMGATLAVDWAFSRGPTRK